MGNDEDGEMGTCGGGINRKYKNERTLINKKGIYIYIQVIYSTNIYIYIYIYSDCIV